MIKCNRCGYENRDDARFCAKCGAPLNVYNFSPPPPPPNPGSKFPMKAILALVAVIVILIIIAGVLPAYVQPDGEILTPSQVSSVIGGTWKVGNNTAYFSVQGNSVSVNYINGTKETMNISNFLGSTGAGSIGIYKGLSSGQVEEMYGSINNTNLTLDAFQLCYENSTYSNETYMTLTLFLGIVGHEVLLSNNTFVENATSSESSLIVTMKGDQVYFIGLNGMYLSDNQLESLIQDF